MSDVLHPVTMLPIAIQEPASPPQRDVRRAEAKALFVDARVTRSSHGNDLGLGLQQWVISTKDGPASITNLDDGNLCVVTQWGCTVFGGYRRGVEALSYDILRWIGSNGWSYALGKAALAACGDRRSSLMEWCPTIAHEDVVRIEAELREAASKFTTPYAIFARPPRREGAWTPNDDDRIHMAHDAIDDGRPELLYEVLTEDGWLDDEAALDVGWDASRALLISHAAVARCFQLISEDA